MFKAAGAISIRVDAKRDIREARGGKLVGENDVTEIDLDDVEDWNFRIDNNKDYESLRQEVERVVERIESQ